MPLPPIRQTNSQTHKISLLLTHLVDNNENFWFFSVAWRIGGNGINDEVKAHYGIDIKLEYLKAECGLNSHIKTTSSQNKIAARLLIPPISRKLLQIPTTCPDKDLLSYQSRG